MKKWICLILVLQATSTPADTIVVPNKYANVDGVEGGLIFPQSGRNRIQQVYDASNFANIPADGILINNFSWREDHGGGALDLTFDSVEVHVSTTTGTSSSLSPVLSNNIGPDEIVARIAAPLRLTSVFSPNGLSAFSLIFPFDHSFYYNPADGNLLIDVIVNKGPGNLGNVDLTAHGEGIGFLIEGNRFTPDDQGIVTQFGFQPVPEPSILSLFGLSILAIFFKKRGGG